MSLAPTLRLLASATAVALLLPAQALAANGEQTPLNLGGSEPAQQAAAGPGGSAIVRTIVGLVIVVALIYALQWVLKQIKASREERASGSGLRALATLPLGPNRSLQLVRAGAEVVLVGVGEGGVTPIRHYGEAEARALGLLDEPDDDHGGPLRPAPAGAPVQITERAGLLERLRSRTVIR